MGILRNHLKSVKGDWRSFCLISVFLILVCLLPTYESIKLQLTREVNISETPIVRKLRKGDIIQQSIFIRDLSKLKNLSVYFFSPLSKESKDIEGKIKVIISQNGLEKNTILDTRTIVGGEYPQIKLDTDEITSGVADIILSVEELSETSNISICLSEQAIYGLPPAVINGEEQEGTLSIDYTLSMKDSSFWIICSLLAVVMLTILIATYVMCCEENLFTGWVLTFIEVLLTVEVVSILFPAWSYEGMAWAEGAVNFYTDAVNKTWGDCLKRLEGGMYFSSVNVMLTMLGVKVLGFHKNIFVFLQYVSLILRALFIAPFCSHYFKKIFNRPMRFAISFICVCYIAPAFEFIGTGYGGVFFLYLIMLFEYKKINKMLYCLILLAAAWICTSKMCYVVFVPAAIVFLFLCWKDINTKKKIAVSMIGGAALCEGLISVLLLQGVSTGNQIGSLQIHKLSDLLEKTCYYTLQLFNSVLWHELGTQNQLLINILGVSLIVMILLFAIKQIVKEGRYALPCKYILVMIVLVCANCGLQILTTNDYHAPVQWDQVRITDVYEHCEIAYFAVLVILGILAYIMIDYAKELRIIKIDGRKYMPYKTEDIVMAFLAITIIFATNQYTKAKEIDYSVSDRYIVGDWKTYVKMTYDDSFLVRLDPDGWFYSKDAFRARVQLSERVNVVHVNENAIWNEINNREQFVFYVRKSPVVNQVKDQYYYMSLFDKNDNEIIHIRQMNENAKKEYIAFYLEKGVSDISKVCFTYEDGTPADIEGTIDIGYR